MFPLSSVVAETALIHWPSDDLTAIPGLSSRRTSRQSRPIQRRSSTVLADSDRKTVGFVSTTPAIQESTSVANKLYHENRRKSSITNTGPGVIPEYPEVLFCDRSFCEFENREFENLQSKVHRDKNLQDDYLITILKYCTKFTNFT